MPPNSKYRSHSSPRVSPASCRNRFRWSGCGSVMAVLAIGRPGPRRVRSGRSGDLLGPGPEGQAGALRVDPELRVGALFGDALALHDDALGLGNDLPGAQGRLEPLRPVIVTDVDTGIGQDGRQPG